MIGIVYVYSCSHMINGTVIFLLRHRGQFQKPQYCNTQQTRNKVDSVIRGGGFNCSITKINFIRATSIAGHRRLLCVVA
jgi:hypothetical protein